MTDPLKVDHKHAGQKDLEIYFENRNLSGYFLSHASEQ